MAANGFVIMWWSRDNIMKKLYLPVVTLALVGLCLSAIPERVCEGNRWVLHENEVKAYSCCFLLNSLLRAECQSKPDWQVPRLYDHRRRSNPYSMLRAQLWLQWHTRCPNDNGPLVRGPVGGGRLRNEITARNQGPKRTVQRDGSDWSSRGAKLAVQSLWNVSWWLRARDSGERIEEAFYAALLWQTFV